jgi:pSer/pThr/pTyr-binding forkhead associated (FHA) protein
MTARINLTVDDGTGQVQRLAFSEAQICLIGRAKECAIVLPATVANCDISRRHCVLKMDPPFIHVRDLGSLNGTYVNGELVGGRLTPMSTDHVGEEPEWFPLNDGDELRIGQNARLRVEIHDFVADAEPAGHKVGSGSYDECPD